MRCAERRVRDSRLRLRDVLLCEPLTVGPIFDACDESLQPSGFIFVEPFACDGNRFCVLAEVTAQVQPRSAGHTYAAALAFDCVSLEQRVEHAAERDAFSRSALCRPAICRFCA